MILYLHENFILLSCFNDNVSSIFMLHSIYILQLKYKFKSG